MEQRPATWQYSLGGVERYRYFIGQDVQRTKIQRLICGLIISHLPPAGVQLDVVSLIGNYATEIEINQTAVIVKCEK